MKLLSAYSLGMTLLLAGCASTPESEPEISGKHKAKRLVEVTYTIDPDEPIQPDWSRARNRAREQCRLWGHDAVESYGKQREECEAANRYRECTLYYVTRTWRCLDGNQGASNDA